MQIWQKKKKAKFGIILKINCERPKMGLLALLGLNTVNTRYIFTGTQNSYQYWMA